MFVGLRVNGHPSDHADTLGNSTELVEKGLPAVGLAQVRDGSNRVLKGLQQFRIGRIGHIRLPRLGTDEDKLPLPNKGSENIRCLVSRQPD